MSRVLRCNKELKGIRFDWANGKQNNSIVSPLYNKLSCDYCMTMLNVSNFTVFSEVEEGCWFAPSQHPMTGYCPDFYFTLILILT